MTKQEEKFDLIFKMLLSKLSCLITIIAETKAELEVHISTANQLHGLPIIIRKLNKSFFFFAKISMCKQVLLYECEWNVVNYRLDNFCKEIELNDYCGKGLAKKKKRY